MSSVPERDDVLVDPMKNLALPQDDNFYIFGKKIKRRSALVVVDLQYDFISGSLALRNAPAKQDGGEVVEVVNDILDKHTFDLVVYTQDWHPADHCSFITNINKYPIHSCSEITAKNAKVFHEVVYDGDVVLVQMLWPPHCIQGSFGAKLHSNLNIVENSIILQKGQCSHVDSYSAFWDNARASQTELKSILKKNKITNVFVAGLATDYCVGATSVHAAEFGFDTYIIEDACRGIIPQEILIRKEQMVKGGVKIIQSYEIPKRDSSWLFFPPASPGLSPLSLSTITINYLLENFLIFAGLEQLLNSGEEESHWFKFGHEIAKLVSIPEDFMTRLMNRFRAGGGNPTEELFHNIKTKFPALTVVEFHNKIRECSRNDVSNYLKNKKLPVYFHELSHEHVDAVCVLLNNGHEGVANWDILAAKFCYTTSEIDYIRSVSIHSGHHFSAAGCLLRKLKTACPELRIEVLSNVAAKIQRNDIVQFFEDSIKQINVQRSMSRTKTF